MKRRPRAADSPASSRRKRTGILRSSATADALDAMHEAGVDLEPFIDQSKARRPGREVHRVEGDLPAHLLAAIDHEAYRLGITRDKLIALRLAEVLNVKKVLRERN